MLFNSQVFILGFLPVGARRCTTPLAAAGPPRQVLIVLASLVFYGWWDVRFVPLLVGLTLANWLIARGFGRCRAAVRFRCWAWRSISRVLALFKYADFLRGTYYGVLGESWTALAPDPAAGDQLLRVPEDLLPDRPAPGRPAHLRFLDFCMFVMFFPQLIAGPIVRHNEIIPQFAANPRRPEMWRTSRGFALFVIGVAKKVCVRRHAGDGGRPAVPSGRHRTADVRPRRGSPAPRTRCRFYFDFSGYSDMAIGLARMFGLRLPFNFDAPYRRAFVRDFWRRWHMHIVALPARLPVHPARRNRQRPARQAANLFVTMLLGGLWHGASWTFVVWGGLHGAALGAQSSVARPRRARCHARWRGW